MIHYDEVIKWFEQRLTQEPLRYGERQCIHVALSALREAAERRNPLTLTLEELQERDGNPVWIQRGKHGKWRVIKEAYPGYGVRFTDSGPKGLMFSDYGKTWLAYDHPPKEAQG